MAGHRHIYFAIFVLQEMDIRSGFLSNDVSDELMLHRAEGQIPWEEAAQDMYRAASIIFTGEMRRW